MNGLTIGSLFTGYGGLDQAVEAVFGARTAWTSDIDPGACKIIAHRYPSLPNHGDITTIDWTAVEPVGLLTAGWPCQPFSQAGKRRGVADERALWPHVAGAIRALRPGFVVLENVAAIATGRAGELARATADLSALGYVGSWARLRAADVGAPHGRPRIFIIATDPRRLPGQPWRLSEPGQTSSGRSFSKPAGRDRAPVRLLPTPRAQNGMDRNSRIWARPLDQPQNLENALARPFGQYSDAIARWQPIIGRPAPDPTTNGRLSPRFVEWMMGLPDGWVTDVPNMRRAEQLKALGNGVVPQQAAAALQHMISMQAVAA